MHNINRNKIITVFFNISVAAIVLATGFFAGSIFSATPISAAGSVVGFVDVDELVEQHPGWDAITPQITAYREKELAKLEKYAKEDLSPAERKESIDLAMSIRDSIQAKSKELSEPLIQDILAKSKEVGREIGVEVVLDGAIVLYGGLDLTPAVYDKLSKSF